MIFNEFWDNLKRIEEGITIHKPVPLKIVKAYWGAPPQAIPDVPVMLNGLCEPERTLGFRSREARMRINIQLLAARARVEDDRSSLIATAFWFAAKDIFDKDPTIGGTVSFATLKGVDPRGYDPTVPVILSHSGQAYIGFNAALDMHVFEDFKF